MVDGTKVVVPDSLDLIIPYVLREQQDWFEDEIKFLRRSLQPGQHAIDIGANYGVYTLSIAKTVGSSGHVWAFEPASAIAGLLGESVAVNGYDYVTLEQSALSETAGTAELSMRTQSELNSLVHDYASPQPTETVRVVTLDGYGEKSGWQDIDFIKIDAEGEEISILKGGEKFFAEHSPLVQYEIKAGKDVHLDLVRAFAGIGYESYRLVPGLDLLVPFHVDTPADSYQLNLFACKSARAAELASGGWLINEVPEPGSPRELPGGITPDVLEENAIDWRAALAPLPYARGLAGRWEMTVAGDETGAVEEALALYALSRDTSRPGTVRFAALDSSFHRFKSLIEISPTHPRLASLTRIARDYGARSVANNAVGQLYNSILRDKSVKLDEPFLAPGKRFDSLDPGGAYGDWMLAAAAEELERGRAFSSFFTGDSARNRLEMICSSNFAGPEMRRRLSLLRQRFDLPESRSSD
jgi:FkbM family methyltransferase